jgi:hypothetical protein
MARSKGFYIFTKGNSQMGYYSKIEVAQKAMQDICNVTSFKGSISLFRAYQLDGKNYIFHSSFELKSEGLTPKEWRELGMPVVDKVKKILASRNIPSPLT